MIRFVCLENVVPYVEGSNTGEVATKLEDKYKVFENFYNFIEKDLEAKFLFYLQREPMNEQGFSKALFLTSDWLTNEFRDYIEAEKHGIKTKASIMRDGVSFLDTGNYYMNARVILELAV